MTNKTTFAEAVSTVEALLGAKFGTVSVLPGTTTIAIGWGAFFRAGVPFLFLNVRTQEVHFAMETGGVGESLGKFSSYVAALKDALPA